MEAEVQKLLINSGYVGSEQKDFMFPNNHFRSLYTAQKKIRHGGAPWRKDPAVKGLT